ncbi:uncharacterized protein LOC126990288 [Eriocheir sinensis]|uniref:uncharacterized protein LOC126990288 n=1 Tax=Eriocheir sinensis TaxID=95602 RepID=UPI0021C61F22|nr:uncharacterized protein LOC126990288 [Eriocheir sinensis]XP_050704810.1 uncharacterized protein LOC126990288 [Eriocheir sinensis]
MFATFYTCPDQPSLLGEPVPQEPTGFLQASRCIVEHDCLTLVTEKEGDHYSVALPCPVRRVWPIRYGILLEQRVTASEIDAQKNEPESLPTFYSLLNPLDETNPLLYCTGYSGSDRPAYMSDLAQRAVFMSPDPSSCILFSSGNNSHTTWKTRRARTEVIVPPPLYLVVQPLPALTYRAIGGVLDLCVFQGPTPNDVVRRYTAVVGKPFLPPCWFLGHHQCRFCYGSTKRTRESGSKHGRLGYPLTLSGMILTT